MIPYFFAAGHVHHAQYGLLYLRSMQKLNGEVLERFLKGVLKGVHIQCNRQGLWNGIWTDMFIETIFCIMGMGKVDS